MSPAPNQQAQVIPEDESFISDEDLFEQAFNDRYGPQPGSADAPVEEGDPASAGDEPVDDGSQPPQEPNVRAVAGGPAPAAAAPAPAAEEPEWMKALPADVKEHLQQVSSELTNLRGQYTALHGRLAPVQQENARLRERLTATAQQPAPQPAHGTNSGQAPVGQPPSSGAFNLDDVAEFKEFKDSFPEEAKALEAVFARQSQGISYLQQQLGSVSQGLQEIQRTSFSQHREQELARLSGAHPDWATVRPSRDFALWLQAQPPEIAQFADSPRADHCIWVLDRYKADAYLARQFAPGESPTDPQPPQRIGAAQQTRALRQQTRLVPSLDPQQVGLGAPNGDPSQFASDEEIWNAEVERRLRLQREATRR